MRNYDIAMKRVNELHGDIAKMTNPRPKCSKENGPRIEEYPYKVTITVYGEEADLLDTIKNAANRRGNDGIEKTIDEILTLGLMCVDGEKRELHDSLIPVYNEEEDKINCYRFFNMVKGVLNKRKSIGAKGDTYLSLAYKIGIVDIIFPEIKEEGNKKSSLTVNTFGETAKNMRLYAPEEMDESLNERKIRKAYIFGKAVWINAFERIIPIRVNKGQDEIEKKTVH